MPVSDQLKIKRAGKDAVLLCCVILVVYLIAGHYDLFEKLVSFLEKYEEMELDEWIIAAVSACLGLVWFSHRRLKEISSLHGSLENRNQVLERALEDVRRLEGIVPICSSCKKIRDDEGFWQGVEQFIEDRSDAKFSHSMCPNCQETFYGHEPWFRGPDGKKRK